MLGMIKTRWHFGSLETVIILFIPRVHFAYKQFLGPWLAFKSAATLLCFVKTK